MSRREENWLTTIAHQGQLMMELTNTVVLVTGAHYCGTGRFTNIPIGLVPAQLIAVINDDSETEFVRTKVWKRALSQPLFYP